MFTSALTGQRVKRVLDAATAAASEHRRRLPTATLNMVIRDALVRAEQRVGPAWGAEGGGGGASSSSEQQL